MRPAAAAALALVTMASACAVSTQQEVEMGQQESQQINSQMPIVQDPDVSAYVNQLGTSIARLTSRPDLPWQFYVVNSSVVNAFALPGGIVYVDRGVIDHASRMDELAGVLGHEIEHVVLRHSVKQMQQAQGANVGVAIGCALTQVCSSGLGAEAVNVGGTLLFDKFSREDEAQADSGGFYNVMRAGISPEGMYSFFEKLLQIEQSSGGDASGASAWFSDHPGTTDRIAAIQQMLSRVPASQLARLQTDSQGFEAMKRRLSELPPPPRATRAQ